MSVAIFVLPNISPTEMKYHRKTQGTTKIKNAHIAGALTKENATGHRLIITMRIGETVKIGIKSHTHRNPAKNKANSGNFLDHVNAKTSCSVKFIFIQFVIALSMIGRRR